MRERSARQGVFVLVALVVVALGLAFVIRMAQPGETSEGEPVAQVWPTSTPVAQLTDTNEPLVLVEASTPLAEASATNTVPPGEEQEEYPPPVYPIPTSPSLTPVTYPLPTYVPRTFPPPSPTPTWPTPTDWPTMTPTPVVTSIPTAELPIIPEALEREEQPFWFIYWEGNQIWRVDDQGNDRELLIDVQEELGQFIEGHPIADSDAGYLAWRVAVSPDGESIALSTVDKINISKGEPVACSIYVFDIDTHDVRYLGEGVRPYWSPAAQYIAYINLKALCVVDVRSGAIREIAHGDKEQNTSATELCWSPDSEHIAYLESVNEMEVIPRTWVVPVDGSAPPEVAYEDTSTRFWLRCLGWTPDGQSIRFVPPSKHEADLWQVSLTTGALRRLTRGLYIIGYGAAPYDGWTAITAGQAYWPDRSIYDAWLLRDSDASLYRVTAEPDPWGIWGWTPDGTRMLLRQTSETWILWSPAYGADQVIDFLGDKFAIGGLK